MDTPLSNAEISIIEFWEDVEKEDFISLKKINNFSKKLNRLLIKCEELRKSRDKWRLKAEGKRY
jgi:hypothetical protein